MAVYTSKKRLKLIAMVHKRLRAGGVGLSEETWKRLADWSEKMGVTDSQIMRDAIEAILDMMDDPNKCVVPKIVRMGYLAVLCKKHQIPLIDASEFTGDAELNAQLMALRKMPQKKATK